MPYDPNIRKCEKYVLAALHKWEKKNNKKVTSYVFEVFEIEVQSVEESADK